MTRNSKLARTLEVWFSFSIKLKTPSGLPNNGRLGHISIGIDHGPDGVSGYNALDNKFDCCVDLWGDPSHGGNRDVFKGLDAAGLKQWWQCQSISFNCPFGPNSDNEWKVLLDATLAHVKKQHNPLSFPLFQESAPKMIRQLQAAGFEFDDDSELSLEMQLWEIAFTQGFERRSGGKITNARFQSGIAGALKNLPYWDLDKFVRTCFVLFVYLFVFLFVYLSVYLAVWLSVCMYVTDQACSNTINSTTCDDDDKDDDDDDGDDDDDDDDDEETYTQTGWQTDWQTGRLID